MRLQKFIAVCLSLSLTLTLITCKTSINTIFSITSLDTAIKATKIPISELVKNYKCYQGQYIETTGVFNLGFEEFAIYTDENIVTGEVEGFWLGIDQELNFDNVPFDKMIGKRVTIKGKIDTTHTGHMNSYLATIDRIYFWKY